MHHQRQTAKFFFYEIFDELSYFLIVHANLCAKTRGQGNPQSVVEWFQTFTRREGLRSEKHYAGRMPYICQLGEVKEYLQL